LREDAHPSLLIWPDEHGSRGGWKDEATGDHGNLWALAERMGLDLGSSRNDHHDGDIDGDASPRTQTYLQFCNERCLDPARLTERYGVRVPHFYLFRTVDAGRLVAWHESARRRWGHQEAKITYTDLLVRLVAAALRAHPRLNAAFVDGAISLNDEVNVGLAVAVEDGLVVPVVQRADELRLREIAARRQDLVARAQAGRLRPEDVRGGTFTLSNLGMYGVDSFSAIINPPQAAILAVGRIAERVVPVDGRPAVRSMMDLTLSCDHRVVDGVRGAQFLATLAELVEEPLALIE
jgi:pyruvate dehydrogenase E2 component (dihydrolipoamide acetyltransferase)